MISFVVPGVPAPQGSKNQFGGESSKRTKPWRADVKAAALAATRGHDLPLTDPVAVSVRFRFPRPASHYGTGRNAGRLKPSAPLYAMSARCGDLDKLCRAIGDALTDAGVLRDDRLIVAWHAVKVYEHPPGAQVEIRLCAEREEAAAA